jgi:hypothetical protein
LHYSTAQDSTHLITWQDNAPRIFLNINIAFLFSTFLLSSPQFSTISFLAYSKLHTNFRLSALHLNMNIKLSSHNDRLQFCSPHKYDTLHFSTPQIVCSLFTTTLDTLNIKHCISGQNISVPILSELLSSYQIYEYDYAKGVHQFTISCCKSHISFLHYSPQLYN